MCSDLVQNLPSDLSQRFTFLLISQDTFRLITELPSDLYRRMPSDLYRRMPSGLFGRILSETRFNHFCFRIQMPYYDILCVIFSACRFLGIFFRAWILFLTAIHDKKPSYVVWERKLDIGRGFPYPQKNQLVWKGSISIIFEIHFGRILCSISIII